MGENLDTAPLLKNTKMKLREYQEKALSTCTESSKNLEYMIFNLIGEVGEVLEKTNYKNEKLTSLLLYIGGVAKQIRKEDLDKKSIEIKVESTPDEMKKELGDVMWQLNGIMSVLGYDAEQVAQMNLDKLKKRKKENKIVGNGDNR